MRRRNAIGRVVSRLRFERNWSQDVLAARLQCEGVDVSRDMLANIESGRSKVTEDFIIGCQRVFQIQIILLFSKEVRELDEKLAQRNAAKSSKSRPRNAKG